MTVPLRLMPDVEPVSGWRGGAVVSDCGKYRYHLWRQLQASVTPLRSVLFVMLNPSTADGTEDDPTIRKCVGFARRWGYERIDVANLFAWRATEPLQLRIAQRRGDDIIGEETDSYIRKLAAKASLIVVAWGAHGARWSIRQLVVCRLLVNGRGPDGQLWCLGHSRDRHPRHPSRLAYDTPLERFEVSRG